MAPPNPTPPDDDDGDDGSIADDTQSLLTELETRGHPELTANARATLRQGGKDVDVRKELLASRDKLNKQQQELDQS